MSDIDWPSRVRLSAALDEAAIVAITDRRGRIVYCNQKFVEVSGYPAEALLGQTHRVVNSGHHPRAFFDDLYQTISQGRAWRGTICNCNRNGGTYWVDTTIIPTLDAQGRPEFYTAIRFEVTGHIQALADLEAAKAELEQAAEVRDLFYANVSHEVRTPLNAVLGLASALGRTGLNPRQAEMLSVIQTAGTALSRQLDDMLDLSKMRAGQFRLSPTEFDLREALTAAAAPIRLVAEAKGLAFDLDLEPAVAGRFLGDCGRLCQVLNNLAVNAVKFTEAGKVRLSARLESREAKSPQLTLTVEDTGIGFDPAFAEALFEPFVQAHEGISRQFGGTGLGLPISKTLTEMMGGRISAEAGRETGSVFTVCLPLTPAPDQAVAAEGEGGVGSAGNEEAPVLRVLVVEDNLPNQMVVRCLLEPMGVEISIANDGRDGVDQWSAGSFEAVLMDMQMPVMDGIAATREIRRLEAEQGRGRTPIVMLTANTTEAHHRLAQEAGCDGVLVKPIDLKTLVEGLEAGVARAHEVAASQACEDIA